MEELRFAKKQQWTIATAAMTLLAAIYAVGHGEGLTGAEKIIAAALITLVASVSAQFLISLQKHIRQTRIDYDKSDPNPTFRGIGFVCGLIGTIIISAVVVLYFLTLRG
ncbi:MAG TPA: hypothetical protein VLU23_08175 [Pseudolabrys sp.]|nr:hypothetical protein [Pseudolabrys sp.]